mgnify:CR=1 FL=1
MSDNVQHFGLGTIQATLGLQKSNLMTAAKLGVGAAAGITLGDLLQSQVLVKNGVPIVPVRWAPLFHALFGIAGGTIVRKKIGNDYGIGMMAGGVGIAMSALLGMVLSRTMSASGSAAAMTEDAGGGAQAGVGFGLGRAFAGSMRSLSGLGRTTSDPTLLFGVGTPDMSGAGLFNGATVAIEQSNGLQGATVAIEPSGRGFASILGG